MRANPCSLFWVLQVVVATAISGSYKMPKSTHADAWERSNLGESRGWEAWPHSTLPSPPRFRVRNEMNSIKCVIRKSMTLT